MAKRGRKSDLPDFHLWTDVTRTGFVTSYFYRAPNVCAAQLADVWAVGSDHTTLMVHLPATKVRYGLVPWYVSQRHGSW